MSWKSPCRLLRVAVQGVSFALVFSQYSGAQADSTDPTEPSDVAPLITIPHRDEAKEERDEGEGEAESSAAPGDPWGSAVGDDLLSLRALVQFRYVTTF